MKHYQLPKKLKQFNNNWQLWESWLKKNNLSPLRACLSFVLRHRQLDGIVVGYNNKNQLNQVLKLKQVKSNFSMPDFIIKNKKLIDSRKWSS